jgi:MYXO-CTERM domain-containing protein
MNRLLAALAVGAVVAAAAPAVHAFCRTTTCDASDPEENCVRENGCIVTGHPLYWAGRCISFGVDHLGSPKRGIDYDTALGVIIDAFLSWEFADCNGAGPSLEMRPSPEGPILCDEHRYNKYIGNANAWIFHDDEWPYPKNANHLALTTLTFDPTTGEIYDVDVEINSADNPLSVTDQNVTNDLLSIVTHEAGHFFGLSHSTVSGSTMVSDYDNGSIDMRSLGPDDIEGICELYPPDRPTTPCDNSLIPRRGFLAECGVDEPDDSGCCATAPGSTGTNSGTAIFASALGLALLTVRRRRSR